MDGAAIATALLQTHPSAAATLASIPVSFRYRGSDGELSVPVWRALIHCGTDGDSTQRSGLVTGLRFDNHYMQPCLQNASLWYPAFIKLQDMVLNTDNQQRFRLEEGEMLIVDNHRMLHGRATFPLADTQNERHLQLAYMSSLGHH